MATTVGHQVGTIQRNLILTQDTKPTVVIKIFRGFLGVFFQYLHYLRWGDQRAGIEPVYSKTLSATNQTFFFLSRSIYPTSPERRKESSTGNKPSIA